MTVGTGRRHRLRMHRWSDAVVVGRPQPGVEIREQHCTRPGCARQNTWTQRPVGWRNERVCDDPACFSDTDHAPHTAAQLAGIARQRAATTAWRARRAV